jgi:hypothetical protein
LEQSVCWLASNFPFRNPLHSIWWADDDDDDVLRALPSPLTTCPARLYPSRMTQPDLPFFHPDGKHGHRIGLVTNHKKEEQNNDTHNNKKERENST